MSTHKRQSLSRWERIVRWFTGDTSQYTSTLPRRSPMAEARAAGWTRESPGYWSHPVLGVVTRERDGTWRTTEPNGAGAARFLTMTEAMHDLTVDVPPRAADAPAAQDTEAVA